MSGFVPRTRRSVREQDHNTAEVEGCEALSQDLKTPSLVGTGGVLIQNCPFEKGGSPTSGMSSVSDQVYIRY